MKARLLFSVLLAAIAAAAEPTAPSRALNLAGAFPAPQAVDVPPDAPLRLTFATPPALGSGGLIRITDTTNGEIVETIDTSKPTAVQTIGGLPGYNYYPVTFSGTQATIHPRNGALTYGRTYAVMIEAGVFRDAVGPLGAIDSAAGWRFSTRAAPPRTGTSRLIVAADGTGDFCTVQGAFDFIPASNTTPVTVFVRRGTYTEIVCLLEKHVVTLEGEDRTGTVIAYANNERFNPNSGRHPYQSPSGDPSRVEPGSLDRVYRRGMFLAHRTEGLVLRNLTFRNTTPHGGSQAEAVIVNGTTTARTVIRDVDLFSYQDTLQVNGQAYVANCRIEGDVDFLWGTGPVFFENCVARSLRSDAYYTQVRNPPGRHGFVFLRCTFEGEPGVTGNVLSRIQPWRFPESEVVLIDCVLGPSVSPVGWEHQGGRPEGLGDLTRLRFWEFASRDLAGLPIDASRRLAGSRQLDAVTDAALIASYRDPAFVLGHGWNPRAERD